MKPTHVIVGAGWTSAEGETSFEVRITLPVGTRPGKTAPGEEQYVKRETVEEALKGALQSMEVLSC